MNTEIESSLGPSYRKLQARWKDLDGLAAATRIMYWDQSTYLPAEAAAARGAHLATLNRMLHELSTADDLGEWLNDLTTRVTQLPDDADERRLIFEAKKEYDRNVRVPNELVARMSEHSSLSYDVWKRARAAENFSLVADALQKNLDLSIEYANALRLPQHGSLMDPLIDLSDEGFTERELRPLFDRLRARLVPLIEKLTAHPATDRSFLFQNFPEKLQREFGEDIIRQMGFDFLRGRQDKTEHPFMIRFAHSDVRITTRFKENDVTDGFFSTVHEAGHALYELGISEAYDGTPLGQGTSSGVHESQSRLWENLVARSRPFWQYAYPKLQTKFPRELTNISLESFYRAINHVERSLIRTDADEVTYNLHVMIRFDLESDLLNGRLKVRDLPHAWNERYRSDLGLTPPCASQGVLQDVHWFSGPIGGAFQGYTIGNILSAQLFAAAKKASPNLDTELTRGEFKNLREWLRTHVHRFGKKYSGPELTRLATGRALDTEDYFAYLESKFMLA